MSKTFPNGFMWGAATSSHQIEGGNTNDWTKWEDEGNVKDGQKSGKAANSWKLWTKDHDILEQLNLNAYRFSIEWSRVEPKQGEFDEKAIKAYRKQLESLRKRGIEPLVTLHHFTNPLWLGDWSDPSVVEHFVDYVERMAKEFGDIVTYWMTINEPVNMLLLGYQSDIWAPALKSNRKTLKAFKHLYRAHNQAYNKIHDVYRSSDWQRAKVGSALMFCYFKPNSRNPLDWLVNAIARHVRNHLYFNRVAEHMDFVGFNYYFAFYTKWYSVSSFTNIFADLEGLRKNDLGWSMDPAGIYHLLKQIQRYKLPIVITENGLADAKDSQREWYIREHLRYIKQAIDEGVDVIGYTHWSLIDNFEWADGFGPRFGLAEVNYDTFERVIRPSARVYAKIAKANSLEGV